jgi:hypothetical protein
MAAAVAIVESETEILRATRCKDEEESLVIVVVLQSLRAR